MQAKEYVVKRVETPAASDVLKNGLFTPDSRLSGRAMFLEMAATLILQAHLDTERGGSGEGF